MSGVEPLAYQNGHWLASSAVSVPLYDSGFVLGVTVSEQLRTFGGKLFRLTQHLDRLAESLQVVGVTLPVSRAELAAIAERVIQHNYPLVPQGADLGLAILVSPGPYGNFASGTAAGPSLWVHSYLLPLANWAAAYSSGVELVTSEVRQVPPACWPAHLKCRSRMHYYLADQEVAARRPGAKALLLDLSGQITETSVANVLLVDDAGGIISPPRENILPGITWEYVRQLAAECQIPWTERPVWPAELATSSEILLTSTPTGITPVVCCDATPIGGGQPGPVYRRLLTAFSTAVGLDLAEQARRAAAVRS